MPDVRDLEVHMADVDAGIDAAHALSSLSLDESGKPFRDSRLIRPLLHESALKSTSSATHTGFSTALAFDGRLDHRPLPRRASTLSTWKLPRIRAPR